MVRTKSVRTRSEAGDGLRLLVTRFRGRGLPASRYDAWLPNLAPSERLLRRYQAGELSWPQFTRAYRAELRADGAVDRDNRTIKNHGQKFTVRLLALLARKGEVTLLCHCGEDETHCHRHLLKALVERAA